MTGLDLDRRTPAVSDHQTALIDQRAFAELYRRHGPDVYGLCLRMTGDAADAEELLQGVFVRAWQNMDRFAGGNFGAWLQTLARNYVLNDRRAQSRLAQRFHWDNSADSPARPGIVISHETRLTMEAAIEGLTQSRRTVFVMHDVEGYHTDEIAQFLGITSSTVRVHLAVARKTIASMLRP